MPTLKTEDETGDFSIRTYDSANKVVLERSYPSSSITSRLTFVEGENSANISTILDIEVY